VIVPMIWDETNQSPTAEESFSNCLWIKS